MLEEDKDPPPPFYEQPEIAEGSHFYWDAFNRLGSDRSIGMGVGPIPYSSVRRYADEFGILSRDEFDFFLAIISGVDAEYMQLTAPKKSGEADLVPISDVESQHLMFDRLRTRAAQANKK